MYNNAKEERIEIFQDTKRMCRKEERLKDSVRHSAAGQRVIKEGDVLEELSRRRYDAPAKVIVSRKRSLEAARGYVGQRVCVLNFASATNPGGGVEKGSNAQEEAICRCSTLYDCLTMPEVKANFHDRHRELLKSGRMDPLYNDDCIYTPGVTVFKTDTVSPKRMPVQDWQEIDVISCAAPNLRARPSNAMNPGSGDRAMRIRSSELLALHRKRLGRVLEIALNCGEEAVVLGAFGCGAFCNPPDIVAEAMVSVVREYRYSFRAIEFAVYCPPDAPENYEVFRRKLSRL